MTDVPAAISGSFADYRLVKSRSVLQLVIEIPVEGQRNAFDALGYPMPGVEIPVAIARLSEPACAPPRERPAANMASPRAGGGAIPTKPMTPAERAVQRAGMLPHDPRFLAWAQERWPGGWHAPAGDVVTEADAAQFIRRECCGGHSRRSIGDVPEYMDRFMKMLTAFQIDVGEIPEPR